MNAQKISQYFFIIAAVISILDGAFALDETMTSVKLMFLIIAGTLVGILRHDAREREFLLAGVAVIFTGLIFTQLMGTYDVLQNFALMIVNFIIFLSTAVIVVGIEIIAEIITRPDGKVKPKKVTHMHHLTEDELKKLTFQKIWGTVILVAVALTFILLLAESFFDISKFEELFMVLNGAITVLFIVDLIILYNDSKDFGSFLKNNVFDIIASIPTVGILRALKIFRAIKIVKVMKVAKVSKLTHLYKTTKFFSEKSYFNKVNDGSINAKLTSTTRNGTSTKNGINKKAKKKLAKRKTKVTTKVVTKRVTTKSGTSTKSGINKKAIKKSSTTKSKTKKPIKKASSKKKR